MRLAQGIGGLRVVVKLVALVNTLNGEDKSPTLADLKLASTLLLGGHDVTDSIDDDCDAYALSSEDYIAMQHLHSDLELTANLARLAATIALHWSNFDSPETLIGTRGELQALAIHTSRELDRLGCGLGEIIERTMDERRDRRMAARAGACGAEGHHGAQGGRKARTKRAPAGGAAR